jgi:predicted transcriptional regulator of viral defense system
MPLQGDRPDWNLLFETAAAQEGYFTTAQAAEAGYSTQLLLKHIRAGRMNRVRRGIYRLVHFPPGEHEELVVAWLWSEQAGVVSHQTALGLHGLSDVLSAQLHLTLPAAWTARRLRVPTGVVLHHANIEAQERTWFGAVPATGAARTLNDCATADLSPELLRSAALQAINRGLVTESELGEVRAALKRFGGLAA